MARFPFLVTSAMPVLARIPSLPADYPEAGDADGLVREGMFLASRYLGYQEDHSGDDGRLAVTRRGYRVRASWRPVPHGVFVGVCLARFAGPGETPVLSLGSDHRVRTNPSGAWCTALRDQILTDPDVLSGLTLWTNNTVTRRGPRLIHERPASSGDGPQRVSVRATAATDLIMRACADGATGAQVCAQLIERWPVNDGVVYSVLAELVRDGLVLTDLLPADLTCDPLGHLLDRLPNRHRLRTRLYGLRHGLARADQHRPGEPARLKALSTARECADQIYVHDRPLTADLFADARLVLPASLAAEASTAAGVLWQTGVRQPVLASCHERFLERYGVHRLVPLSEVTDPAIGLGLDTGDELPVELSDRRRAMVTGLLARAAATGAVEVVLDDTDVAALTDGHRDLPPPRTAELTVRVIAASVEDLASGRLHLVVCPGGLAEAGTALGRFTSLLHPEVQDRDSTGVVAEIVASHRISRRSPRPRRPRPHPRNQNPTRWDSLLLLS